MSPMRNGYSIYVGTDSRGSWMVRCYRDSDDTHIHSAENAPLSIGLREVEDAIFNDLASPRPPDPKAEVVEG